jgi:hypothetical protein
LSLISRGPDTTRTGAAKQDTTLKRMPLMAAAWPLVLTAFLAACGGGSGNEPSAPPTQAPQVSLGG